MSKIRKKQKRTGAFLAGLGLGLVLSNLFIGGKLPSSSQQSSHSTPVLVHKDPLREALSEGADAVMDLVQHRREKDEKQGAQPAIVAADGGGDDNGKKKKKDKEKTRNEETE